MGEVYRADDLKLGQTVALKFLPRDLAQDPQRLEYFHSEVRLTRQISHPNVCRVYDIGEFADQSFVSMEYVDGEDLRGLLRRIGRLPRDKGVEIARQLCLGLAAAHDKGVLHRDLKPANIMLDGRGQVRITDFGLAKLAEDGAEAEVAGTPAYMAPEQLARGETTIQSDLYSLGLILHEIITGEAVHKSNSIPELLQQHQESSILEPSALVDDMDPVVERVIVRCLRKEAPERPKSAREVAAALPGGDPLLAALAAGETPSPEMVAAAGKNTVIERRPAVAALAAIATCLLLNIWVASQASVANRSRLREPAELRVIARNMLEDFGYREPPGETLSGFGKFGGLNDGELTFYYRERPDHGGFEVGSFWSGLDPHLLSSARPDFLIPDWNKPGELGVVLSGEGQLLYFRVVPPLQPAQDETSAKWTEWFTPERTGLQLASDGNQTMPDLPDDRLFEVVDDVNAWLTPPDAFDATRVWKGAEPYGQDVLIEAAAFRGRPTYFKTFPQLAAMDEERGSPPASEPAMAGDVIADHTTSNRLEHEQLDTSALRTLHAILLAAGILLAWHNVRLGRGDRVGGRRLAACAFVVNVVVIVLHARHSWRLDSEFGVFVLGLAQALFSAAQVWVWYMALEPIVRRVWPQILITASRLLDGRWRDPLVGRDLLAGALAGTAASLLWNLNYLGQMYLTGRGWISFDEAPTQFLNVLSLGGTKELVGSAFASFGFALFTTLAFLMMLLISRIVLKTERRAVVGCFAVLTICFTVLYGGHAGITLISSAVFVGLLILLLVRFGVLALLAAYIANVLTEEFPLTLDTSRWYFGHGMFAVALVAAIAVYGFYTSQGGRRAFFTSAIRAN